MRGRTRACMRTCVHVHAHASWVEGILHASAQPEAPDCAVPRHPRHGCTRSALRRCWTVLGSADSAQACKAWDMEHQYATYIIRATCSVQRVGMQRVSCIVQRATCVTAYNMQRATCNGQHAACNVQQAKRCSALQGDETTKCCDSACCMLHAACCIL